MPGRRWVESLGLAKGRGMGSVLQRLFSRGKAKSKAAEAEGNASGEPGLDEDGGASGGSFSGTASGMGSGSAAAGTATAVANEPASSDEEALKEFLASNFLYEEPAQQHDAPSADVYRVRETHFDIPLPELAQPDARGFEIPEAQRSEAQRPEAMLPAQPPSEPQSPAPQSHAPRTSAARFPATQSYASQFSAPLSDARVEPRAEIAARETVAINEIHTEENASEEIQSAATVEESEIPEATQAPPASETFATRSASENPEPVAAPAASEKSEAVAALIARETTEAPTASLANAASAGEKSATKPVAGIASEHPHIDTMEWRLEEALGSHREWVESQGRTGRKANFANAKLEGTELIGVNLRYADLQDANLNGADLLLADLRDACLVRTDFEESCLVGANLEGANLEGASLDSAMGLLPRQLAGANLRAASIPAQIQEFPAMAEFVRGSGMVARYFVAVVSVSLFSWLMIWKTKDVQLLTDASILPFLRSPAAAVALPTAEIYLIAPALLFIVYLVFHYHLQRLWDSVLELPAVFPDGRELGVTGPRIVGALARAHFRWMSHDSPSTRFVEKGVAMLLAYWLAPVTLALFWGRYLTRQEMHGTVLQEVLVVVAAGVAIVSSTRIGRQQERWVVEGRAKWNPFAKLKAASPKYVTAAIFLALTFLSLGTIRGAPHDTTRAPQFMAANIRRWAPTVFWSVGYDPYTDLTEAQISTKPANWTGGDEQVASVKGARLNNSNFRYAQAYGVFLAGAHLWRSDFEGAFMSEADLRGADLGQSNLRLIVLDRAQLRRVNLDRSNLDGANLSRADFREANLSYTSIADAFLVDARLDGATLYGAKIPNATMIRANLEKADLREAVLSNSNLTHADLQQAYLWSAKLPGANLQNAQLAGAIFIDAILRGADLRGAQFNGTVLTGADLQDADLDGADLRGVLGLSASQICTAKSRRGAVLDEVLQTQVDAQCGGAH
jgi:uncharacterized protein YjbI with pentapeptide repeats